MARLLDSTSTQTVIINKDQKHYRNLTAIPKPAIKNLKLIVNVLRMSLNFTVEIQQQP